MLRLIALAPAMRPAEAWLYPWDLALDLFDAAAGGGGEPDDTQPVLTKDGRRHAPWMAQLIGKLNLKR